MKSKPGPPQKARESSRMFWTLYIILAGLFAVQILPFAFPESRMWGFNQLLFLPPAYTVSFGFLGALALILPYLSFIESVNKRFLEWFATTFFDSPRKYLYRIIYIGICTIIFIKFSASTHFLGDGYALLGNLASQTGQFVKWSERGVTLVLLAVRSLLGAPGDATALSSFRIVSYLSGAISIWFMFLIAGIISDQSRRHLIIFAVLFFSGILLLFFGYVENYPMVWIGLTGSVYFALKYLRRGQGLILCGLFLLFGMLMHLEIGIFIPPFIFLLLARGAGYRLYRRFHYLVWTIVCVTIIIGIYILFNKYSTSLYIQNFFLPFFAGKPFYPAYSIFSLSHLADILNQLFLLFPLFLLLVPLTIGRWRSIFNAPEGWFFLLTALAGLVFLFIIDPTLGMPRDWDLFSIAAFNLIVIIALALPEKMEAIPGKLVLSLIIFSISTVVPGLVRNINTDSAIAYAKYTARLDPPRALSVLIPLHNYFKKLNDTASLATLHLEFSDVFEAEQKMERATKAGDNGDYKTLRALLDSIPADNYSSRYHLILSQKAAFEGHIMNALDEMDKAIQLQQYNFNLYTRRSMIYAVLNKYPKALSDLQMAYRLNNNNTALIEGMGLMQLMCNQPDSALFYTDLLQNKEPDNALIYYIRARANFLRKDYHRAQENARRYIEKGRSDSKYPVRKKEMEQVLQSL